jgi:hypothetical protein
VWLPTGITRPPVIVSPAFSTLALSWVWIEEVASRYPSVVVVMEELAIFPDESLTITLEAATFELVMVDAAPVIIACFASSSAWIGEHTKASAYTVVADRDPLHNTEVFDWDSLFMTKTSSYVSV